jgi:DNA-binding FadR family transcriptional regulator
MLHSIGLLVGPVGQMTGMPAQAVHSVLDRMPELRDGVVRRNVRDIVADKIASLIASGTLQVGDELPGERDLAGALQVSRETVRGGMQILATRGIIEVSHGARTRVISADVGPTATGLREPKLINSYDIEAIHAARLLVERQVVAEAASRIDEGTLAFLDESLAAQARAIEDPVRFLICDREFHTAIYRACGNPVLADFVGDLYVYMMEYRRRAVSRPGAIQKSYQDHQAIVAGLRSHDAAAVVAAFDVHLERIYATTIAIIGTLKRGRPTNGAGGKRTTPASAASGRQRKGAGAMT